MKIPLILLSLTLIACSEPRNLSSTTVVSFDKKIWQSNITSRKTMLKDFLSQHKFSEQNNTSIIKLLGKPDGYYLYDEFPAYRLKEKGECIVAFPIDRKTGKVKEVIIEPANCIAQIN